MRPDGARDRERSGAGPRDRDLASLDEDGYLWIHGRADDVIIGGGFKLSAGEVADVLLEHPQVIEAAVVPRPDARLGEVPAKVIMVDTLPRNAMQKIVASRVQELFDT